MNNQLELFNQSLNWRYATKQFDPSKRVEGELFNQILESARLAPSSYGLQPWKFVVVADPAIRLQLRAHAWNQSQITDASHLVVLCAHAAMTAEHVHRHADHLIAERGAKPEEVEGYRQMMLQFLPETVGEKGTAWMANQVYLALGMMLSACAIAGVDACPMEGFDAAKFDEVLKLPQMGLHARVLCAIGYRASSDWLATQKKVRFAADNLVVRI